jgi:hypothetical protein
MLNSDQTKKNNPTIRNIAHDALHDLMHFDAKLFRSLPLLLFRPGKLTQKSLSEERDQYIRPFALFVFINFVFFIVKSRGIFDYKMASYQANFGDFINNRVKQLHIPADLLAERFNMAMRFEQKEYLVIMVPLFALVLQALYFLRKTSFPENLIFSLNFYAFFIIFLMIVPLLMVPVQWLIQLFGIDIDVFRSQNALLLIVLLSCFSYLSVALRNVYHEKIWLSLVKAAFLSVTVIVLIALVYRLVLFFVVMHTVGE